MTTKDAQVRRRGRLAEDYINNAGKVPESDALGGSKFTEPLTCSSSFFFSDNAHSSESELSNVVHGRRA